MLNEALLIESYRAHGSDWVQVLEGDCLINVSMCVLSVHEAQGCGGGADEEN